MDYNLEDQVLIMQDSNYKLSSEFTKMKSNMKKIDSESTSMRSNMNKMEQNSSPDNMNSPKAQDPYTAVLDNNKAHHWKVDIKLKLVACGLSNMRSAHQKSLNSSSRHNSNVTLLCSSRTSTTTSRCV